MPVEEYLQMPKLDMFGARRCDQCRVIELHFLFLTYEIDADLLSIQMEDAEDRLLSSERRMS